MNWIKLLLTVGWTVFNADSSIFWWRFTIGLTYKWAMVVAIIISTVSSTIYFRLGGMIRRKKKTRGRKNRNQNWHIHRKVRASAYLTKKRLFTRIAGKFGLPVAVCIVAAWPTILFGWAVHVPTLVLIGRTGDRRLLIAYLIGNTLRIPFSATFVRAIEWLWYAIF
ncbi:MAG: hypothetical protein WC659_00215 [Patescibacteria group bacterium]